MIESSQAAPFAPIPAPASRAALVMILALGAVATSGLPGCRAGDNARLGVGSDPTASAINTEASRSALAARDDTPVPLALDRTGWTPTHYELPIDGTRHFPSYAALSTIEHSNRQAGLYPSPASALTIDQRYMHTRVEEFGGVVAIALLEAVLIVPKVVWFEPPIVVSGNSPNRGYQRTRTLGWLAQATSAQPDATAPSVGQPGVIRRVGTTPSKSAQQPSNHAPTDLIPIVKPAPRRGPNQPTTHDAAAPAGHAPTRPGGL